MHCLTLFGGLIFGRSILNFESILDASIFYVDSMNAFMCTDLPHRVGFSRKLIDYQDDENNCVD